MRKTEIYFSRALAIGLLTLLCLFINKVKAQQKKLDSLAININKSFKPTIADAIKINESPTYKDSTLVITPQQYNINSIQIPTFYEITGIKPAKMIGEPLNKLYNLFVKAGFGNYTTPYAEVFYNSIRSRDYSYGIHYKHLSSHSTLNNVGYSGYSDNELNLYGKKFYNKHTLIADLNYLRNTVHYYGFDDKIVTVNDDDAIRQTFNFINPTLQFKSHYTDSSKLNYDLKLKYYNLSDAYKTMENNVFAEGVFKGYYDKQLCSAGLSVDFYNTRTIKDTTNNNIVRLTPSVFFNNANWNAKVGAAIVADFASSTNVFFYPNLSFSYNVSKYVVPYVGADGSLQRNSYRALTVINPFVTPGLLLKNTDTALDIYGGIRGSIDKNTSYNVKGAYVINKNMALFINDQSDLIGNKFTVVYDDVDVFNLHAEIIHEHSSKLKLLFKGDYFHYSTTNQTRAWHKPEVQITASAHYNLRNKFVVKGDVFYIGKQLAKFTETNNTITIKELDGIVDMNLGLEYKYSKLFGFFLNFNNIGAFQYYRWNNYPLQRFNLMGGLTVTF